MSRSPGSAARRQDVAFAWRFCTSVCACRCLPGRSSIPYRTASPLETPPSRAFPPRCTYCPVPVDLFRRPLESLYFNDYFGVTTLRGSSVVRESAWKTTASTPAIQLPPGFSFSALAPARSSDRIMTAIRQEPFPRCPHVSSGVFITGRAGAHSSAGASGWPLNEASLYALSRACETFR